MREGEEAINKKNESEEEERKEMKRKDFIHASHGKNYNLFFFVPLLFFYSWTLLFFYSWI